MYRREVVKAGTGIVAGGVLGGVLGVAAGHETPTATPRSGTAASSDGDGFEPLAVRSLRDAREVVVSENGRVAYVAVMGGYAVLDVSDPAAPRVLAERRDLLADHRDGPLTQVQDVKVDGDRLLVVGPAHGGPEFRAAVVVDVSDPSHPRRVAVHETAFPIHNAFLRDGYAYLTGNDGDGNPLVVVDVSGDDPVEVGRWSLPDLDPAWEAVAPRLRSLHDVWVQDGVAYLAHWDAGTVLLDVRDPTDPTFLGRAADHARADLAGIEGDSARRETAAPPGNAHYVTVDEDGTLMAVGSETWAVRNGHDELVGGPSGIVLWDVSDPTAPHRLGTVDPPETTDASFGGVWVTAHNFELRGDALYAAWYQGGVTCHDVSDPSNPRLVASWRDSDAARFWTAQVGVPGEFLVASDMGVADGEASIYTFPDPVAPNAESESERQSETEAGTTRAADAGAGEQSSESAEGSGEGRTRGETPDAASARGFGLLTGATALGIGLWAALRRRR